jgi:hypothetical protein
MTIAAKLVAIIGDLPGIEKKRHAGGVTYEYRGIEQITTELQPLLVKHGVVITPFANIISVVDLPEKGKGGWTRTTVSVTYTLRSVDDRGGEFEDAIIAQCIGVGDDNADKGVNKGMTQAFKYLLLQTFCIADPADDGDSIPNPVQGVQAPAVRAAENADQSEEAPPPVPEGWSDHAACLAAHDELNDRVKKLSAEQKARCSQLRRDAGGGWPLSLTGYESLAAFVTASEAFGPDAVPTLGGEVAPTPDGF